MPKKDWVWHFAKTVRPLAVTTLCGKIDEPASGMHFEKEDRVFIGKSLLVAGDREILRTQSEELPECFACLNQLA